MAKKRMISCEIIESDKFYALSPTAQAIYFHLNLNADDDGVVDNWQSIIRTMKARKEHLSALFDSELLLQLPNGAIFITHWSKHNSISPGRYIPGIYRNELTKLIAQGVIKKNHGEIRN